MIAARYMASRVNASAWPLGGAPADGLALLLQDVRCCPCMEPQLDRLHMLLRLCGWLWWWPLAGRTVEGSAVRVPSDCNRLLRPAATEFPGGWACPPLPPPPPPPRVLPAISRSSPPRWMMTWRFRSTSAA